MTTMMMMTTMRRMTTRTKGKMIPGTGRTLRAWQVGKPGKEPREVKVARPKNPNGNALITISARWSGLTGSMTALTRVTAGNAVVAGRAYLASATSRNLKPTPRNKPLRKRLQTGPQVVKALLEHRTNAVMHKPDEAAATQTSAGNNATKTVTNSATTSGASANSRGRAAMATRTGTSNGTSNSNSNNAINSNNSHPRLKPS